MHAERKNFNFWHTELDPEPRTRSSLCVYSSIYFFATTPPPPTNFFLGFLIYSPYFWNTYAQGDSECRTRRIEHLICTYKVCWENFRFEFLSFEWENPKTRISFISNVVVRGKSWSKKNMKLSFWNILNQYYHYLYLICLAIVQSYMSKRMRNKTVTTGWGHNPFR